MKFEAGRILTAGLYLAMGLSPLAGQTPAPQKAPAGEKPLLAEDVFTNVKVLRGIPVNQFMETMGFFSASLGYNCTNCHGNAVVGNWPHYADDVPIKNTARRMVTMVNAINKAQFGGAQVITCYTCHRGGPTPKSIPSLLEQYSEPSPEDPNEVERSSRASSTPSADDILNRYTTALGGAQRLAALTSYVGTGRYVGFDSYHGGVSVDLYAKASGERSVVIHTQNGDQVTTYDAHNAWIMGPDKPVSVLQLVPGGDLDGVKLDSALAFPGRLKQALTNLRTGFPTTTIEDRPVDVLEATAGTSRVKLFFDKETGLLTRMVRFSKTVVGSVPVQVDYSDYREVAGVKLPFQWNLTWTDGQSTFTMDEIKANVAIDAAKFAKPVAPAKPAVAPAKITK